MVVEMEAMKRIVKAVWPVVLLAVLPGCSVFNGVRSASKNSTMFCPGVERALSGGRESRSSVNSSKPLCAADRLRLAMQIMGNADSKADLVRARALVDSVQNGTEVQRDPAMAGLASFLERVLADRRRADERMDRLAASGRDQQQRLEELNGKLQALTSVERTMAQKASKKRGTP